MNQTGEWLSKQGTFQKCGRFSLPQAHPWLGCAAEELGHPEAFLAPRASACMPRELLVRTGEVLSEVAVGMQGAQMGLV